MTATVIAAIISILGIGFLGMLGYFLQGIRADLRDLRTEIRAELSDIRAELRDVRSEIAELRAEVHQIDLRLVRVETLLADSLAAMPAEPAPA